MPEASRKIAGKNIEDDTLRGRAGNGDAVNGGESCRCFNRRDQRTVAVFAALCLAGQLIWLGLAEPPVDIDRAPRRVQQFCLDINRAEWPEWTLLPRVGETLARRIVQSRCEEGPFRSAEDLRRVRGIGPRTLENMRPYLMPVP
jgi:competence ComEA-like helix-hairpin-helix protein